MIRSLKWQALLATVCLAASCGCSAMPFPRDEPEEVASRPPAEGFGWQQRLAELKARRMQREAQPDERVASTSKGAEQRESMPERRLASATGREVRSAHSPAEKSLSLGRWVKPAKDKGAMRTFDVQRPEETEPEALVKAERRSERKVERPVSYDAPERVAKPEVKATTLRAIPPQPAARLAPLVAAPPAVAASESGVPENRLRRFNATAQPAAEDTIEEPEEHEPPRPQSTRSAETVPWQQATFRSLDE